MADTSKCTASVANYLYALIKREASYHKCVDHDNEVYCEDYRSYRAENEQKAFQIVKKECPRKVVENLTIQAEKPYRLPPIT